MMIQYLFCVLSAPLLTKEQYSHALATGTTAPAPRKVGPYQRKTLAISRVTTILVAVIAVVVSLDIVVLVLVDMD